MIIVNHRSCLNTWVSYKIWKMYPISGIYADPLLRTLFWTEITQILINCPKLSCSVRTYPWQIIVCLSNSIHNQFNPMLPCDAFIHQNRIVHSNLSHHLFTKWLVACWRQVIIRTNADLLFTRSSEINFSVIWIQLQRFHTRKWNCKCKCRQQNGGYFVSAWMC